VAFGDQALTGSDFLVRLLLFRADALFLFNAKAPR
jgi:hypothetical protein